MCIRRYCAGILTENEEDFYWDIQFETYEECIQWAINRGLTHIYDNITDKFFPIYE